MSKIKTLRRLTVQEKVRFSQLKQPTLYPTITIEGTWLKDAGFEAHTSVYVIVEDGKITLKQEQRKERA